MSERDYLKGICSTCIHLEDCEAWLKKRGCVIWFCEEFDTNPLPHSPKDKGNNKLTDDKNMHDESSELKDLCATCGIRETCRISKPASGVWRCSYYV